MKEEEVLDILEQLTNICIKMNDKLYEKSNYDDIEFLILTKELEKILNRISKNKEVLK